MVLFSLKKIEKDIINRTITPGQLVIYLFFELGSVVSLLKTSRYPVNMHAYNATFFLSFFPVLIHIVQYYVCYKIVKHRNPYVFLYSVIPVNFILSLRYLLLIMLPLVIINLNIINGLNLNFEYWNVINSQIITIIYTAIVAIHFNIEIRKIMEEKTDIPA
jgi:hypothetical protein